MSHTRFLIAISLILLITTTAHADRVYLNPTHLRCEYKDNPVGIDVRNPRLSWELEASDPTARNQRQIAYQIWCGTKESLRNSKPDLWDSGKVTSDQTNQIVYAGNPLKSGQQILWLVRIWSDAGASPVSSTASFTMGLLDPADFVAQWIGYDAPDHVGTASSADPADHVTLEFAKWVWFDEGNPKEEAPAEKIYLRKQIDLDRNVKRASAILAADNDFHFTVNGQGRFIGTDFKQAVAADVTSYFHKGKNVLAIQAGNSGGPAGVTGRIIIEFDTGAPEVIDVDKTWLASKKARKTWRDVDYSTTGWTPAREIATVGDAPWGTPSIRRLVLPPPPYLRTTFNSKNKIKRATLYATALGLYEIHLNGQRVCNDYFTPGWTDYRKRVYYNTYDVTSMIQRGKNAFAAILADGWYDGYLGYTFKRHNYDGDPRLRAQINIEYTDGSSEIVTTNDSWKASYGPLREADLLMGTTYDSARELGAWDTANFDDSAWQPVVTENKSVPVQAHPGNPVRIDRTFIPNKITEPKPHVYVFDLGQNMVGWAKFQFKPTPNKPVVVRYSEMLNADGTPYTVALRSARATDTYVPKSAAAVTWEPAFTFHGFRYVEISGLDYKPDNDAVTGIVAHTQLDQTGEFACSNKLVNQLFHNIIWGQKGNYLEVPTDCPQRDERLGWTGDAQFFARTGTYNMDVAAFFTKWLVDLVEDSQMKSGGYTHVAPSLAYDDGGGTAWQDAAPICTYTMYRFYGDTRIIQQHWASLSRYMDYLHNTSKDLVRNDKPFGDWLNLGGGAKSEVIGTAYYAHIARIMSEMAAAIDNKEDAAKYAKLADDIKQKFVKEFLAADGLIKDSSQTGYALAFTMDLIPDEFKIKAADHFAEEIRKKDWHLATGFIGTPRLLPSLTLAGRTDLAYRLLLTDTFPSWLYPVTLGSTTMWERWDGWRPETGFQNPGMNSFNHYAFGSVGEWLYATVAGIQTDGPGFRKIIIQPAPTASLQWARGKFHSINGIISSEWTIENGRLTMNIEVPPNTTATIYVPTPDPTAVTESGRLAKASPGVQYLRAEKGCAIYKAVSGHYTFSAPL